MGQEPAPRQIDRVSACYADVQLCQPLSTGVGMTWMTTPWNGVPVLDIIIVPPQLHIWNHPYQYDQTMGNPESLYSLACIYGNLRPHKYREYSLSTLGNFSCSLDCTFVKWSSLLGSLCTNLAKHVWSHGQLESCYMIMVLIKTDADLMGARPIKYWSSKSGDTCSTSCKKLTKKATMEFRVSTESYRSVQFDSGLLTQGTTLVFPLTFSLIHWCSPRSQIK